MIKRMRIPLLIPILAVSIICFAQDERADQTDIPLALLFFNVGVEVGQLLFIAGALLTIWMIQKITFKRPVWLEQMPAYVIGSMASFWFIERTVSFW